KPDAVCGPQSFLARGRAMIRTCRMLLAVAGLSFIVFAGFAAEPASAPDRLTSRPRPAAARFDKLPFGEEVRTGAAQRRRVLLGTGPVLHVNQNTRAKLDDSHKVLLNEGEIVIDVPATEVAWDVQAGKRTVSGRAARFAVTAAGDVLVLHGKVEISDLKN